MKQVEGVITQVIDLWKFHSFWMVEVEVLINGDYTRIDIQASTERERAHLSQEIRCHYR